jgi:integrase
MAWITERVGRNGDVTYCVRWRERGNPKEQSQTYGNRPAAERFKGLVELAGNRWPAGMKPGDAMPEGPTFKEWALRSIDARTSANERSKADYRKMLARHVFPVLGQYPLGLIGREEVARWINGLEVSRKTIANLHALCSSIMLDAVAEEHAKRNPFEGMAAGRGPVRVEEMVFLTPPEFRAIVAATPEHYRPLVRLLGGTGLRWGEATALQPRDIELFGARRTLRVARAWKRTAAGTFELGEPKTRRSRRTLVLGAELVDMLIPLVATKQPDDLLFTTRGTGQPIKHSNFYNRIWIRTLDRVVACPVCTAQQRIAAEQAGVRWRRAQPCGCPGYLTKLPRIHDLRHSHVSWLIAAGLPAAAISRRVGHESITTTIDRYGHMMPELDDAFSAAVDTALRSPETATVPL